MKGNLSAHLSVRGTCYVCLSSKLLVQKLTLPYRAFELNHWFHFAPSALAAKQTETRELSWPVDFIVIAFFHQQHRSLLQTACHSRREFHPSL